MEVKKKLKSGKTVIFYGFKCAHCKEVWLISFDKTGLSRAEAIEAENLLNKVEL